MVPTAHADSSTAAARSPVPAGRPLELLEARRLRDSLKVLLGTEQSAMADFLVALADFDVRRGWEALGHASLFAFLHTELRLSNAASYWRMSAARLLQGFPAVIEPLRDGRLCLTTAAELAKVLTAENCGAVLPRFFGISAREAKEVVAELQPRQAPTTRMVVTSLELRAGSLRAEPAAPMALPVPSTAHAALPDVVPQTQLRAPEVDFGGGARTAAMHDDVEPLTADLRRLHVTVSARLVKKLDAARDGLSHTLPNATAEQVLEAALDLLLEKQGRVRGQVKRPRATVDPPDSAAVEAGAADAANEVVPFRHRRAGPRPVIPAAVKRAVWERDAGRCTWPLDSGGTCGSTHRLELDHVVPWAKGGEATVANLRIVCHRHNALAAQQAFGARLAGRYAAWQELERRDPPCKAKSDARYEV